MERYCVGDIYGKQIFQTVDSEDFFNIRCKDIVEDVLNEMKKEKGTSLFKDENMFDAYSGLFGNYSPFCNAPNESIIKMIEETVNKEDRKTEIEVEKERASEQWKEKRRAENFLFINALRTIGRSLGGRLDLLKDIYLTILAIEDKKERLYFKRKGKEEYDKRKAEAIDVEVEKAIKSRNENEPEIDDTIFNMEKLKSRDKGTETEALGINVKRLWLYSKFFRNLFAIVDSKDKYNMSKIAKEIKKGKKEGLDYGMDDCIILEKLLGMDIYTYIYENIISKMKAPNYEALNPLIDILMEYDGTCNQNTILSYFECDLYMAELKGVELNEQDRIKTYAEILQDEIDQFAYIYHKIINTYIQESAKRFTFERTKKELENELFETVIEVYGVYKCAIDDEDKMKILAGQVLEQRIRKYESLKGTKNMKKIQGRIIEKRREKYNGRDAE